MASQPWRPGHGRKTPAESPCRARGPGGGGMPSLAPPPKGAEVRGEPAAPAARPARLQPVAPAQGVWGARGRRDAGGRQGGGTAAAASLLSKFLAVAHLLSASCGGERLALPARPAANSRRKEAGRREWGRGGGGTQRAERGRTRRAPGSRKAGSPPPRTPREGAAAGGDGTAGHGRPRGRAGSPGTSFRARTRDAGGSAREAHASPVRARAARYLPREQVRSESSAGSARRRPRRAGGRIPAAGAARPIGARGRETRREWSCAAAAPAAAADPSPPAPLLPPWAPPRRLRLRPLAADFGSVLEPVPEPAWLAAGPRVPPAGEGRGQRRSSKLVVSAASGH